MKNICLILLGVLWFSGYSQSKVKVFSDTGSLISLYINGELQNETPSEMVTSEAFVHEFVRVRVKGNGFDVKKSLALEKGKLSTLMLVNKNGIYKLKYYGISNLEASTEENDEIKTQEAQAVVVDESVVNKEVAVPAENLEEEKEVEKEVSTKTKETEAQHMELSNDNLEDMEMELSANGVNVAVRADEGSVDMHMDHDEMMELEGLAVDVKEEEPSAEVPELHVQPRRYTEEELAAKQSAKTKDTVVTTVVVRDTVIVKEVTVVTPVIEEAPCNQVSESDLSDLLKLMKGEVFDEDKKNLAKMALKDRCYNTSDVQAIANEFFFDEDKYELVAYAYDQVLDPENYYKLLSSFTFSEYKEKLTELMNK